MSIVLQGSTSGSITLQEPAVAGSTVLSLPATTGTVLTSASPASDLPSSINGPAFSAYASTSTGFTQNVATKVTFDTEDFDTNNNFASSRFTPTVAGYYQINASVAVYPSSGSLSNLYIFIYKNGSALKRNYSVFTLSEGYIAISHIVYMNGSTDYLEIYTQTTGTSPFIYGNTLNTYCTGALIRSA